MILPAAQAHAVAPDQVILEQAPGEQRLAIVGHGTLDFSTKAGIFETFRKLHPILKEQHFLNPKEEEDDPYESSQMTVMIANPSGIFAVYSMREVFEFDRFWAIGSGRDFALGAMYALYDGERSAAEVARAGVLAGAEFDTGTALPIELHEVKIKA